VLEPAFLVDIPHLTITGTIVAELHFYFDAAQAIGNKNPV
jgi:hypothetical protein